MGVDTELTAPGGFQVEHVIDMDAHVEGVVHGADDPFQVGEFGDAGEAHARQAGNQLQDAGGGFYFGDGSAFIGAE
jgi:hypothetical protein